MGSKDLVPYNSSSSVAIRSVGSVTAIGLTAVIGPAAGSYGKDLIFRLLIALVERLFRSFENIAVKFLESQSTRLREPLDEKPKVLEQIEEEQKKPKVMEAIKEQEEQSGGSPFNRSHREPPAWMKKRIERRQAWRQWRAETTCQPWGGPTAFCDVSPVWAKDSSERPPVTPEFFWGENQPRLPSTSPAIPPLHVQRRRHSGKGRLSLLGRLGHGHEAVHIPELSTSSSTQSDSG